MRAPGLVLVLLLTAAAAAAQEFKFDPSEFAKKPYELGGYVEGRGELFRLAPGSALYQSSDPLATAGTRNDRATGLVELSGSASKEIIDLGFRFQASGESDADAGGSRDFTLLEGGLTVRPSTGRRLDLGKQVMKWGKGYAWNPVGFVERGKDPTDPDLSREGFWMASADTVWSLEGPVQTVGLTPVLLPVSTALNRDFGRDHGVNAALKLYLLAFDTDVDFMVLTGGTRTTRYGADFSRNLAANLEIHGEVAHVADAERRVLDADQNSLVRRHDALNWLLGLRYLSDAETTYIAEYYRNGGGFTEDEGDDFFDFTKDAAETFRATGSAARLNRANTLAQGGFAASSPFRNYLNLRVSQKEPFDILYLTPAISVIANIDDASLTLGPELTYTGFTNWELRLKGAFNLGSDGSEYGEKRADTRLELRARRFF